MVHHPATSSAEALLTILNDILDLSTGEAGRVQFESTPFDVGLLVADVGPRPLGAHRLSRARTAKAWYSLGNTKGDPMTIATTVKLPETLRERIRPLADAAGKSVHAWMVDALSAEADREEARRDFVASALAARLEVAEGGPVWDASPVFAALRKRAQGQKSRRPAPRKARR